MKLRDSCYSIGVNKGTGELRVLSGGRDNVLRNGKLSVLVLESTVEFGPCDAIVREDDTYRVLAAPLDIRETAEHPIRLMTAMLELEAIPPGTVFREGRSSPEQWVAIVYDTNESPMSSADWVASAYEEILDKAMNFEWKSVLLPLLGVAHGGLSVEHAALAFADSLGRNGLVTQELRILLAVPEGRRYDAIGYLHAALDD